MKSPFHSDTYKRKQDAGLDLEDQKDLFLLMLEVNRGNITVAAMAAGISRQTAYNWKVQDEAFMARMAETIEDAEEGRLDRAEEMVDMLVETVDGATVRWFLDRKGRKRGYGQVVKQRHGGVDGPRIPVDVVGTYPPKPATLEDWEAQQAQAKARKAQADS